MQLRRFTRDDADLVTTLNADPEVMRFLDAPESLDAELDRLSADHGELGYWAAFDHDEFVGWFCAVPDGTDVSIGYRLVRAAWGRGLATEGAREMVRRATAAGATKVTATTMAVNTASRRVLEKAGLHHVRTWHGTWEQPLPGAEHGDVDYEMSIQVD